MTVYKIISGDTFAKIAKALGVSEADLKHVNTGIKDINLIYAGENINIPTHAPNTVYTVVKGDMGIPIAKKFNIEWDPTLKALNPAVVWEKLDPGQTLIVPKAGQSNPDWQYQGGKGTPIIGIPSLMPLPNLGTPAKPHDDHVRAVTGWMGANDATTAALSVTYALDWPSCFALLYAVQGEVIPSTADPYASGAQTVIVDLRQESGTDITALPWKIPAATPLPCVEGSNNAKIFDDAVANSKVAGSKFARMFQIQTSGSIKRLGATTVLFVDTHGHTRAVEMTARYIRWLQSQRANEAITSMPYVAYMAGGMVAFCNAQCFGRAIMNTRNAYVTGWPPAMGNLK